jgi:centrosomal CEP192-like protein/HYDIN/CFA65/VesB family protein
MKIPARLSSVLKHRYALRAIGLRFLGVLVASLAGHCVWASEPMVSLSANELDFAPQIQGTNSVPQLLVLLNNGQADLIINSIALSGENVADFAQTNNCPAAPAVLAAGNRCEIRIIFTPTATGTMSAAVNFTDNASGSPHAVALKGVSTTQAPVASVSPASLPFGNQAQGTSSAVRTVTITNTGSGTLNINSDISISGPAATEFRIQPASGSCPAGSSQLAPKASCTVGVVFTPTTIGAKTAQLLIVDDAQGSPHNVQLSGMGTSPQEPPR